MRVCLEDSGTSNDSVLEVSFVPPAIPGFFFPPFWSPFFWGGGGGVVSYVDCLNINSRFFYKNVASPASSNNFFPIF
jgi:hypothetical protein